MSDNVHGYTITQSIVFENDRGFAVGENPAAVEKFATWQFTEENGERDYYWGHYCNDGIKAENDFFNRSEEYQQTYGVAKKGMYKYYSTQRPVDIGTFPKTEGGPVRITNFDERKPFGKDNCRAWGFLEYKQPLTEKQIDDYELKAARGNPDMKKSIADQMKEATAQAAKDNATRTTPTKKAEQDR